MRFIHRAASSVAQHSCNCVNELKCLVVALTPLLRGAGVNLSMEETKSIQLIPEGAAVEMIMGATSSEIAEVAVR